MAYSPAANGDIYLELKSTTEQNYVSGTLCNLNINIVNRLLGSNNVVTILSSQLLPLGFTAVSTTSANYNPSNFSKLNNFVLTDLGTPSVYNNTYGKWNYGNTLKGSYTGTIYTRSSNASNDYIIPKTISIDFEAYRL